MDIRITPRKLHGTIAAIPSKSDLHRALICAGLAGLSVPADAACSSGSRSSNTAASQPKTSAQYKTRIDLSSPSLLSEDSVTTINCLAALGAEIRILYENGIVECAGLREDSIKPENVTAIEISAVRDIPSSVTLDCAECGSTLRFLLPVAAGLCAGGFCEEITFTGRGRLPERPLSPLIEELEKTGCTFSSKHLPLTVRYAGGTAGQKTSGPAAFTLPGNISSQYVTGLLLATPLLGGTDITLTTALSSSAYVDMTIDTMGRFGIPVEKKPDGFRTAPGSYISSERYMCDGGWSNAAFFIVADALSKTGIEPLIVINGLRQDSLQGDRVIAEIASDFFVSCASGAVSEHIIDADEIPDLVPIISVLAALTPGVTRIINAGRLKLKESNRLHTVAEMLRGLGGTVCEIENDSLTAVPVSEDKSLIEKIIAETVPGREDGLLIYGKENLSGGTVSGYGDHRIVMAAAVASIGCLSDVTILGAEASTKSYPAFWDDFKKLGGEYYVN